MLLQCLLTRGVLRAHISTSGAVTIVETLKPDPAPLRRDDAETVSVVYCELQAPIGPRASKPCKLDINGQHEFGLFRQQGL